MQQPGGNAPGNLPVNPEALKARHGTVLCCTPVLIPRLQRFDREPTVNLGRWPRLLHHAPLALNASNSLVPNSRNHSAARRTVALTSDSHAPNHIPISCHQKIVTRRTVGVFPSPHSARKIAGVDIAETGNLPGRVGRWENTHCPSCDDLL